MHHHHTEQTKAGWQRDKIPAADSRPSSDDDLQASSGCLVLLPVLPQELDLIRVYYADLIAAILLDTP